MTPLGPHDGAAPGTARALVSAVAFVTDHRTEEGVQALFDSMSIESAVVRRGQCRDAITYLTRSASPGLIIVDLSGSATPLSDVDELVNVCGPNVVIIALGELNDVALYRDLSMFGVADYVVKPVTAEVLRRTIGIHTNPGMRNNRRQRIGKVICVTGARGGVGVTTFATNLGWALANDAGRRTVIVDLDLHCGSVGLMLGLKASVGFMEALRNPHRIDDLFLDRAVVRKSDRLMVLSAEEPLEDATDYNPAALDAVLRTLQQRFHFVVMDLPRRPGPLFRQALEHSEIQIILASPTLTAVRDATRIAGLVGREDLGQRALLVLAHLSPPARGEITRADIERTMGRRVDHEFAFSKFGVLADNQGEMLTQLDPAYAASMTGLVNDLVGRSPMAKGAPRRLFSFARK